MFKLNPRTKAFNIRNSRQYAREHFRKAVLANLPDCYKCDTTMFTVTESRFFQTVKCPICGKTITTRKRG